MNRRGFGTAEGRDERLRPKLEEANLGKDFGAEKEATGENWVTAANRRIWKGRQTAIWRSSTRGLRIKDNRRRGRPVKMTVGAEWGDGRLEQRKDLQQCGR
ncbi:hypothetical protein ACLOJK_035402 [Asimina triloba]